MSAEYVDVAVIGAGLVGLASAEALAATGRSVVLLERHPRAGMETSTHNSGVIHAGLYYPTGTLKALLCVEGAERLYAFGESAGVDVHRSGKFVVAQDPSEVPELERLFRLGTANGTRGLEIVDAASVRTREPHVRAFAALWSPNSGRVDAHSLVSALQQRFERAGGILLRHSELLGGQATGDHLTLHLERENITAAAVVNAAGLYADEVSTRFGGESFTIYPCRGEYAELKPSRRDLVRSLVYPIPHPTGHGLGVHLTRTINGTVMLGPTIRYQDSKSDYENGREPLESFLAETTNLLPDVTLDDLRLGGSGIRAKLHPPQEKFADFMIRADRNQPALIHAAGIDSPGLTACLAIGARVARLVAERI